MIFLILKACIEYEIYYYMEFEVALRILSHCFVVRVCAGH